MRLLLVSFFVVFASINGATAQNSVPNLNNDIYQIMITALSSMKTAMDSLSPMDGGAGQQLQTDLMVLIDRIQEQFAKVFDDQGNLAGNIDDLTVTVSPIEEAGTLIANYIKAVMEKSGSTPGNKLALQQIADVPLKGAQDFISALRASGFPVPQAVYDAVQAFIAAIEKAKATIV